MAAIIDQYRELAEQQFRTYNAHFLAKIHSISTTTYVLTILAICIPPIILLIFYEREQARLRAEQPKGCRKLGMNIESNLSNEFDRKFSEGRPPSTEETSAEWWRLKSMWIYPVKSCRGVELNRGTVIATGMEWDRQFTFAQLKSPVSSQNLPEKEKPKHKWDFITQKQFPLLAQIRTEMWVPDQSVDTYAPHCEDVESGGVIILSFPYQAAGWRGTVARWGAAVKGTTPEKHFRVPFDPSPAQIEKAGYTYEDMTVWKEKISALNLEIEIPEELRYYLGISNKLGLFRIDNSKLSGDATVKEVEQPILGFQDAYPLHLVNLASIRDIERQTPRTKTSPRLSAATFRANLIITGPESYHEDTWRKIKIGFYEYDVSPRMKRCPLAQPVSSFRDIDEGAAQAESLGMQLVPCSKESALRVGDEVTVLEVTAHADVS